MKTFVVMTYYQLMHAIAVALTLNEKPRLYFHMNYYNQTEEFLDRIRATGVFDQVTGITYKGDLAEFLVELRKTSGAKPEEIDAIGNSLFEEYLESYYGSFFKESDFNDDIFVYNDFQWYFYYISKHFNRIIGVEDGYMSLLQQTKVHEFKGDHQLIVPFIERGYFPEPLYKSEKIHTIISSCYFDELSDYYKNILEVIDFKKIVDQSYQRFGSVLSSIFEIDDIDIEDKSVLMLGQPLDRTKDATPIVDYLMNRKFMTEEIAKGYHIYYKPHPAEKKDSRMYASKNVTILPRSFPVELFNYIGCHFDKAMTFSSTGLDTLTCASEYEMKLPARSASRTEIQNYIKELTKDEYIEIHIYLKIRNLNNESLLNLYSCFYDTEHIKTTLYALVDETQLDEARDFLSVSNYVATIRRMAERQANSKLKINEIALNEENDRIQNAKVTILACKDYNDWSIFREFILKDECYDYIMVLEENNYAYDLIKNIDRQLEFSMPPGMVFKNHTYITDRKRKKREYPLFRGYHRHSISGQFCNRLWHKCVIDYSRDVVHDRYSFCSVIYEFPSIARKRSDDLYIPPTLLPGASEGFDFFIESANNIANDMDISIERKEQLAVVLIGEFFDWQYVCVREAENRHDEDALHILDKIGICDERIPLIFADLYHCNLWDQDALYRNPSSQRKQKQTIMEKMMVANNEISTKSGNNKHTLESSMRFYRKLLYRLKRNVINKNSE